MSKAFTKGQKVTHLASWDSKGTVTYRDAIVHSCGTKQMVLTDEATGQEMGRRFSPEMGSLERVNLYLGATFPRMTEEEAIAASLKFGGLVVEYQRKHYAACLSSSTNARYKAAIEAEASELHEPRAMRYPAPVGGAA